jgi:hypothetical protein
MTDRPDYATWSTPELLAELDRLDRQVQEPPTSGEFYDRLFGRLYGLMQQVAVIHIELARRPK